MAAQWQININRVVSPDTVESPPAQDAWASVQRQLQRQVSVDDFTVRFDPPSLNVEPGDQIFWTNNDSQPHWPSLLKDDGTIDNSFFMPNQIAGDDTSPTFSPGVAATLTYVCCLRHREPGGPCSAAGTIVVTSPPP